MKYLITLLLLQSAICLSAQTTDRETYADALALIDKWVDAQKDFDRLPGVSVAIVKDQDILWSKGFGYANVEKKVPMSPQTLFSICSISKLFTSIAIMQLVEQGKIRLDDSINAVLPSYTLKQQFPDSGPITIRSLLTHSSGLPREADFPYWTAPDFPFPPQAEMDARLGSQHTWYPASTYYQYSNLALSLLGEVVAHVSGLPYEQYVEENILNPLRLAATHPSLPEKLWGSRMAIGYSSMHRNGERQKMPFFHTGGITPAAGFSSNAEDLARFASWQFRLLKNGGREILKASTLRDMQRVQFLDPNWKSAYGLGFAVREYEGLTIVGHGGSCPGYLTSLQMDTKNQIAVIVMFNGQGESLRKYSDGIYNIIKEAKATADSSGVDLAPYIGNYENYTFGSELLVFKWKGKLAMIDIRAEDPLNDMGELQHVKGDVFRRMRSDGSPADEIVFVRNPDGSVKSILMSSNYYKRL